MNAQILEPTFNGRRLKILRKKRGLSVERAARKADVSVRHFRRLEAGQRPKTAAITLARIALALDTTVEYFLGITDDTRSIDKLTDYVAG
jgi:transcriptional regulator with XRE-family HTH domain